MPTQGVHFHCNVNALTPTERARHKELAETLMAKSGKVVETDQAYEFHYRHPEWVSAVSAESKCCPFFDFHIDLQKQGQVLLLRLSGEQGIKQIHPSGAWNQPKVKAEVTSCPRLPLTMGEPGHAKNHGLARGTP